MGGEMIALTSSTIMQNLVEIEQHTSVGGDKVFSVFVSRLRNLTVSVTL